MTTELLPEVKEEEPATQLPADDAAPPTQAEPVTEPEASPPADLEAVTTKFLQDRGYELPTQDTSVQDSTPTAPVETLTPEQVEARAQEIAEQRLAEQQRAAAEQGTVVDYRNRAERIRGTLAKVASGEINLAELIPNTTVTWAQAISNEFDNHHAQAGRVAVNSFVQNLWADLAQDVPADERKAWLNRRTQDKTLEDLRKDYRASVTKGMISAADADKKAKAETMKALIEYKAEVAKLLPGYTPPTEAGAAAVAANSSSDDAKLLDPNTPIATITAIMERRAKAAAAGT